MFENKKAFTLAEALTSLVLLGLIAALTLPNVISNYQDKAYIGAQKAMSSDLSNAIGMLVAEDGSINSLKPDANGNYRIDETTTTASGNEAFVKTKLAKVLKIARICNPAHTDPNTQNDAVQNCGVRTGQSYLSFDRVDEPNLDFTSEFFINANFISALASLAHNTRQDRLYPAVLADGTTIFVGYNYQCNGNSNSYGHYTCVNIIYDVNGAKAPNQVGRDIGFFTAIKRGDRTITAGPVLYEMGEGDSKTTTLSNAEAFCADLAPNNKAGLPTQEEAVSIFVNRSIIRSNFISSTGSDTVTRVADILNKKSSTTATGAVMCVHQ